MQVNVIIRANGTVEPLPPKAKGNVRAIGKAINAEMMETINLKDAGQRIMFINDVGIPLGLPLNEKATKLYHKICIPGTTNKIHGDVAIVCDEDFEE